MRIRAGVLPLLSLAVSATAFGQNQSQSQSREEIIVTGSRVSREGFDSAQPLTAIDSNQIQNLGIVNTGDILRTLPQNTPFFTETNVGIGNFNVGSQLANLRGLNPFFGTRTLTLVDTKRVVPQSEGGAVDLTLIPSMLVERTEVVTGGASAAYGSDAIAGVVNVILNKKLEGFKAQFDLDNTLITAPINGLIERSRYYEGRLVSAQTDLLTVVHRVDPMFVVVSVPESFILKRRRDIESKKIHHPGVYQLRGRLTMMDDTAYPHEGMLDLLEPGLRTETGSRQTRITFPNPDRTLLPGQFVKVRFTGDTKTDAILIPQRAVLQGPQGPFVYVVGPEEKVQIRDIVASNWKGDQWMIDGGLKAGDRVVVNGLMTIGPGAPVKAVPWKSTAAPAADPVPPAPKQG